jgi:hypothetical protein
VGGGIHGPDEADCTWPLPWKCRGIIQTGNASRKSNQRNCLSYLMLEAGIPAHRHKWVQCADSSTQDLLTHMSDICDSIDQMASPVLSSLSSLPIEHKHDTNDKPCRAPPEAILTHCDLGISRSPTIIVAHIMRKLCVQQADVLKYVQSKQRIKPSPNFTRQLQVWEDEDKTVPKAPYKAYLECE